MTLLLTKSSEGDGTTSWRSILFRPIGGPLIYLQSEPFGSATKYPSTSLSLGHQYLNTASLVSIPDLKKVKGMCCF